MKLIKPEPTAPVPKPKPPSLLDKDFYYVPSNSTDVARTFARHGFIPPSTKRKGT